MLPEADLLKDAGDVAAGAELDRHLRGAGGQGGGARAGRDGQRGQRALPPPLPPRLRCHRRRAGQPRLPVLHGGPPHPPFSLSRNKSLPPQLTAPPAHVPAWSFCEQHNTLP